MAKRGGRKTFVWRGEEVKDKVRRATGRACVAWAENVVAGAKATPVHRLTGTLSRSLHSAGRNYSGKSDKRAAMVGALPAGGVASGKPLPDWGGGDVAYIEAGSWIDYAIYEYARGGSHDFITAANKAANSRFPGLMRKAIAEEGMMA